jgi:mono/diheme cytochrome c family protein
MQPGQHSHLRHSPADTDMTRGRAMRNPASRAPLIARLIAPLIAITLACFVTNTSMAANLLMKIDGHQQAISADVLLKRPDAKLVDIALDPAYKKPMHYHAIPLASFLQENGIKTTDDLSFVALDGFSASLPASLIFNSGKSRAWLAVETANDSWPPLNEKSKATTGPFYLVWTNPEAAGISQEQWPFQIARIEKVEALEKRFPMLLPDKSVAANSPIRQGFSVFQKNCLVCHKLNGGGDSSLGPDLNIPHNPTEYFQASFLKQLIRNPRQVRTWPDSKMPGFDEKVISDGELDVLVEYLKHMGSRSTNPE